MDGAGDPLAGREIILESVVYGGLLRVVAVDAASGVEASAVGPPAARADLQRLAMGKLARALSRAADSGSGEAPKPERGKRI